MYKYLKIKIVNIDASNYPPIARCEFLDSYEKTIVIIEKLDILTNRNINEIKLPLNEYLLKCKIINVEENKCKIDISEPYGVFDINNNCIFKVEESMLSSKHYDE